MLVEIMVDDLGANHSLAMLDGLKTARSVIGVTDGSPNHNRTTSATASMHATKWAFSLMLPLTKNSGSAEG
jgi:hypothetical protein